MQHDNTEEKTENVPVDGDRDPMPFENDPSGDNKSRGESEIMPLARLKAVYAFKQEALLFIYVEGFTYGYGGRLIVEQRPEKIVPPLFHVHEHPGLGGINPHAAPKDVPTFNVYYFDAAGIGDSILVQGQDGREEVKVLSASRGDVSAG